MYSSWILLCMSVLCTHAVQGEIRVCALNQVAEKLNFMFEMGKVSDQKHALCVMM